MTDLGGQTIRGYELQDKIGEGGFGAVYRAFQPVIEREVAIKVILAKYANQPDFIRNFEIEAQVVARLEHPHIVPLYDYWRDPDGAYLVMRWFQGNLRQMLNEKGALTPATVLHLLEQIAAALNTSHRKQVIHRDLKPDNILLDDEGNAYLTDFGIARISGQDPSTQSISGTIAYTSPEQLQSLAPSPQMDVYSLGIMLYEMLSGQHPFMRLSPIEMVYHHMQHPIPDISTLNPELPPKLNAVLQQATAKDITQRYATTLDLLHDFRAVFADGTTPKAPKLWDGLVVNPYKGLRAFDVADAADFFGRENLVHTLVERLRSGERFLAIVGPSGSGKSSVVKAGLIAALRGTVNTDTNNWFIADCVPGTHPLHNLAQALSSISPVTLSNAEEQLASNERGLIWLVDTILADTTGEIALVIDQFEEVFILADEQQRNQLLLLLTTAISDAKCRMRVVLTLRADFYDRPLLYEGFGQLVQDHTQVVLPLSAEELESAITSPAQRIGLKVETELIAAMVSDVREEPGALPLLQYTLTDLFERRDQQTMTLTAYRESGGVLGVLAQRADEVYQTLADSQQTIARQVFLRLVTLGEGTEDTRRRVQHSELQQIIPDKSALNTVLDAFGKARLLTFDVDSTTREPLIEVAHEALIREWQQLRQWLTDSRNDIRLQRMLASAATEWRESNQDGSYLLRGSRLAQFEEWARTSSVLLSPNENTYLEKSIDEQEADFDARQRTQLERQQLQMLVYSRQQQVIFALGLGVVLALILTGFAFLQANKARNEANANATAEVNAIDARQTSDANAAQALDAQATSDANAQQALAAQATSERRFVYANAQQLALRAEQVNAEGQTLLALGLAVEVNRMQNPPPEAIRILSDLSTYSPILGYLDGHSEPAQAFAFTPDGQRLLSGTCASRRGSRCSGGELLLWDIATGAIIHRMAGHANGVTAVAIAADGRLALSGASDGSIILWDLETGQALRFYEGGIQETPRYIDFSPDGLRFGVITVNDIFVVREFETGTVFTIDDELAYSFAFSPDSTTMLLGTCSPITENPLIEDDCEDFGFTRVLTLLDAITGEVVKEFDVPSTMSYLTDLAFSKDGKLVIAASVRELAVWDIETAQIRYHVQQLFETMSYSTGLQEVDIAMSLDDSIITVATRDGRTVQIDLPSGKVIRSYAPPAEIGFVAAVTIAADGQHLAMRLLDNRITIVQFNSPDQLYDWVLSHRTIQTFPCEQRVTFGIEPRCDADGNIPPTPTPYPTITPFPTVTIPVWTPIPSPTATE